MSEIDDLKERVALGCRVLAKLSLTREPAGHVSARIPGTDHILIRGRGQTESGVRYTKPEDVIVVDLDGKKVGDSEHNPPREVFIHTWMFKTQPQVQAVIHIHPPTVVLFTIVGKPLLPLYGAYDPSSLALHRRGIPLFDRSILINDDALGKEFAETMGDKEVCLMRGHGITTTGTSVEAACLNAIRRNELAEMNYRAALLGTPRPISDEDYEAFKTQGAGSQGPPRDASRDATWLTYKEMVGE